MASISGDENATQENDGPRRTRSGRKSSAPIVTPTRATRRSTRKKSSDDISESDEKQILIENAAMPDIVEAEKTSEYQQNQSEIIIQNERSSSFPFAEVESISNLDTDSQQPESNESTNNFLANLVEENANSLPPTNVEDAEMVSEDELPAPAKQQVEDAEEVSDEELPGPKLAELPADTEVVSEDELPCKRKADTENSDTPQKRIKVDADKTENDANESNITIEKEPERKTLPDLDKYWKAVNDDPSDFTGWTYLLQYVEQENDTTAAREAYDAFLAHYPYCYGYWRKYADYEKRKGNKKKCEELTVLTGTQLSCMSAREPLELDIIDVIR